VPLTFELVLFRVKQQQQLLLLLGCARGCGREESLVGATSKEGRTSGALGESLAEQRLRPSRLK
jgi:hypothetical protein